MPAMLAKKSGYILLLEEQGRMKRRHICRIPDIDICMIRQQHLRQRNRTGLCRHVQGRFPFVIGSFNLRMPCDQEFHSLFLLVENRCVQRRRAMRIFNVDIGTIRQQQQHDFLPTLRGSHVQRSIPVFISRSHIRVKSKKNPCHLTAPV